VVIDRPSTFPEGWKELGASDPSKPIKLTFALRNENVDKLEELLLAVSTPGHELYGNHRTSAELYELIAPKEDSMLTLIDYLQRYVDFTQIKLETPNADMISIQTTISTAEDILNTEYYDYQSVYDHTVVVSRVRKGLDYDLDEQIAGLLYLVTPTHRFPYLQSRVKQVIKDSDVTAGEVNPTFLRSLYNLGSAEGSAKNNSQGIASFRGQTYDQSDVQAMWTKYNLDSCTIVNVPSDQATGHHLEAELDTQYISSMGEKVEMQVWLTSGINFENALLEWTTDVLNSNTAPPLFSVSYGGPESDFGGAYIDKLNTQLMMMGTAGITVMFAAGDSGAGGGCSGTSPFDPDYPASSPYVTAVGGVSGGTPGKLPLGESAWVDGGGGFSNFAGTQSWQKTAVEYYLNNANNLPDSSQYNASGRGFPDIAAQSVDFEIIVSGKSEAVSGTSCASPTAGGVFALLNDLRVQNGMSKMGFLNPFIYSTAATNSTAFFDTTDGYNKGCSGLVQKGFYAIQGWDPATGYGSPNYAVLSDLVLKTGESTKKFNTGN
jgi:tripeptidyl-peptidase-1